MKYAFFLAALLVGSCTVAPAQRDAGAPLVLQSTQTPPAATAAATKPAIPHNFAQWEREIAAFETADRTAPPPKNGLLFIGSSTIRMWRTLATDYPGRPVINRGFGGSEIVDATHFIDRIVFPYSPRAIYLRAGSNDLHNGRSAEEVAADFAAFVAKTRERLPDADIYFLSLSPVPSRWDERQVSQKLNALIRDQMTKKPHLIYVDTWDITLDPKGEVRRELFQTDMLHFNAEGYKLLVEKVRPYVPAK